MRINRLTFQFILISLFLLDACAPKIQTEEASTKIVVTETASRTQTEIAPTITPIPTLSVEAIRQRLLYFVQENGGCQLPCIWGLMPGMTSSDREIYLNQFREVSTPDFYTNSLYNEEFSFAGIGAQFINESTTVYIGLKAHEKGERLETLLLRAYANDTTLGRYKFGDENYIALTQYYQLSQILLEYGQPSRALFAAWQYDPITKAPYDPISLVLIYDNLNVMVEYVFPSELVNGQLVGCPKGSKINVFTWSKNSNLSLESIVSINPNNEGLIPVYLELYKPIEVVTSLSLEEFYQLFQSPEECITTPAELWPPS